MQVPWPPRERGFDSRRQSHVLSVTGANSQCRWGGGAVTVTWRVRTPAHAAITPCQRRLRCVIGLCARACRRRLIGACAHCARTLGRLHSYGGQHRHQPHNCFSFIVTFAYTIMMYVIQSTQLELAVYPLTMNARWLDRCHWPSDRAKQNKTRVLWPCDERLYCD